jgi:hypothetical protein
MKIDGGCHCGNITYTAEIDPEKVRICHCTDCQQITGTAYRVVVPAPAATFAMRGGKPTEYIKTAESGAQRAQGFCPQCGTPLYSTAPDERKIYGLRVGTIRQRAELKPKLQQWCRSKLEWAQDLRGVPQAAKQA